MRITFAKAVVLVLLLTASVSADPINFDFLGGGSRAEGMGKAFYGLSDDASAVSWNPAGLMDVDEMLTGFAYSSFLPRGEFRLSGPPVMNTSVEQSGSFDHVTLFSFISPLRIKGHPFVGSISYTRVADDYTNGGSSASGMYVNLLGDSAGFTEHAEGQLFSGLNAVNLGFGTRLMQDLSFGLALNIYNGTSTTESFDVATFDDWSRPGDPQTAERVVTVRGIDSMTYKGVNITLGLKYHQEDFSLGLVVKTPYKLEGNTDHSQFKITRFAGLVSSGETDTVYSDDNITQYEIPTVVGIGLGYHAAPKLTLAADVEYRPYDGQVVRVRDSVKIIPGENDEEFFSEIDPRWNNVVTARVGGEYMWETGSQIIPMVPIRAGFAYLPIPTPDVNLDSDGEVVGTDKITGYNFSLGSGVHWDQIKLDFAYTYSTQDQSANFATLKQELENRTHHLSATFTGVF